MEEKLYKVLIENKPIEGTAVEILTILSKKNFFIKYDSLKEFIERAAQDIWRMYGIGINPHGNTVEEKAQNMMKQLLNHQLLREYDEHFEPTNLNIALKKSEKYDNVYITGWINDTLQRRKLQDYPGKTLEEKYKMVQIEFGENIVSFEFPDGESIRV